MHLSITHAVTAQESLIALQQTDLENRITLWQSLGGGIQ